MNEHRPDYDPELELKLDEIEKLDRPKPYDAKRQARRLLNYFFGEQDAAEDNTTPDSEL